MAVNFFSVGFGWASIAGTWRGLFPIEDAAYKICMQKTCTQLFKQRLWKCPALAYWSQLEQRLYLEGLPEWQLFRDYKACSPECSDAELAAFLNSKAIQQCGLCPSKREPFHHPDPTQRSELK